MGTSAEEAKIPTEEFKVNHVEDLKSIDTPAINDSTLTFEQETTHSNLIEGKTSVAAWIETIVCVSLNSSCAIMWMTASSTPAVMTQWMGISLTQLNWLSNYSAICNSIFSLLAAWVYDRVGIKTSLIMCGVINAAGCWIRCIAIGLPVEKRYAVYMIGQIVSSIGGPLIYNVSSKFVAAWFAPKDRGVANTLLSIQLGMAIAPLVLPYIGPTVDDIPRMLIIVAVISTVCAIPTIFMPKAPKIPPSPTSALDRTPFWEGVKQVSKSFQFWVIAVIASVTTGMVCSVSVLVIEAITPYGYTDQESGLCASVIVFAGFFGGVLTGYWIGKTGQYIMVIKMLTPVVMFTYVIFIFELIPNAYPTVLIACILNGFFSYALFPVYLELASEFTYPVSESISSCIIWSMITGMMLIFTVIIDALRAGPDANPPNNMKASMIAVSVIVFVGNLPFLLIKGELKRLTVDNKDKEGSSQIAIA